MKKSIALLASLLLAFGLKAQTTKPAKKETTKPASTTTSVTPKPTFTKAAAPLKTQATTVVHKKPVQSGKRY